MRLLEKQINSYLLLGWYFKAEWHQRRRMNRTNESCGFQLFIGMVKNEIWGIQCLQYILNKLLLPN